MLAGPPITAEELAALEAAGLGEVGARLLRRIEQDRQEIERRGVKLEKLMACRGSCIHIQYMRQQRFHD